MSSPHSPSTMNDNEELMLFHPPPPLHIISTQDGAPSPIEGSADDCLNEQHALNEPSHEQHRRDDQEATEEVNQQQQPAAPRPQERPNKIRLKFDPSAATAAAASPQSDEVPVIHPPRRLKVALKGNPVSLVVKKHHHHHDVDAPLSADHHQSPVDAPRRGVGNSGAVVHESLLVTPLQTARSVLQAVLCEFDEHIIIRTLLANNITTPAVATQPPPRGRNAPSSSSSHQLPSLQRQGVSDPYFLHVEDEDGCDAVREELLQWHLGLAKWRHNYWYTTRRPPHSSSKSSSGHNSVAVTSVGNGNQDLDEIALASIHIQRLVEWKLHAHTETSAFVLTPPTAHALYALDLGWSNDASREFREPVDTVQYPSYLDSIGGVPCCLADLYDYVRGGAPESLISVIAKPLTLSLVAAMDLIGSNCKAFNGASSDFLKDWWAARNTIQRELKSSQASAVMTRTDGSILSLADAERKMHAWFPRRVHVKQQLQVAPLIAVPSGQVSIDKRGAPRRGGATSAQPVQGHEVVNVDNEEDEISLVARREAQLSAPDTWPRKETIVVRGKVFEQLHDKWVECGSCLKWRLVPYDASKFKTWNCAMIKRECGGADDELVDGVGVMGSGRATNQKRGPYKKKEQPAATLVDDEEVDTIPGKKRGPYHKKQKPAAPLVDDEEVEDIPDKMANRHHSKRDRNLPDRLKHDKPETRRDRERARLFKQKGLVAVKVVSDASKRHRRSRVDDSDDTTSSPSSDSETDSTASSSSMSSSSSAPPAKNHPTSRKEVHKAVAAVGAPSAMTRTSASTTAGGGSTADHAGLQELLATFNATAITRRGDATDAQLLKRLRDLTALEGKLKDLQKNGAR